MVLATFISLTTIPKARDNLTKAQVEKREPKSSKLLKFHTLYIVLDCAKKLTEHYSFLFILVDLILIIIQPVC